MTDTNKLGLDLMDLTGQGSNTAGLNIELETVQESASDRVSTKASRSFRDGSMDETGELLIQKSDAELH